MELTFEVLELVILFGGIFALVLALGQLARKNPETPSYLLGWVLVCLGYSQIVQGISFALPGGYPPDVRHLLRIISISTYYTVGPAVYLFFMGLLDPEFQLDRRHLVHFVPLPLSAGLLAPGIILNRGNPEQADGLLLVAALAATFWTTAYFTLVAIRAARIIRRMHHEKLVEFRAGLVFAVVVILLGVFDLLDRSLGLGFRRQVLAATSWAYLVYFLIGSRYPMYLRMFQNEATRIHYEKSSLGGVPVDAKLERLRYLVEVEKIHTNGKLTLPLLAKKMNLLPHQLSELLNTRCGKNFCTFINDHRIREAQALLLQDPGRPVLAVALDAGFETTSAFYTAFKKATQMTPSRYRAVSKVSRPGSIAKETVGTVSSTASENSDA